jgi:hypothetical protein
MTFIYDNHQLIFLILLAVTAFLYSSVGHGGASGYLALMALFDFSQDYIRSTALLLNLFVAAIAFYHFWGKGYFKKRLFLYFAVSSIPFSFIGGLITLNPTIYHIILGLFLLFSIFKLATKIKSKKYFIKKLNIFQGLIIGSIIGFFSGLIGIGGGIILSPLIIFMRWGTIKEAAAVSALFIWVNSAAGLIGQYSSGLNLEYDSYKYIIAVVCGGFFGGLLGSSKLKTSVLKNLLIIVLFFAFIKLILI